MCKSATLGQASALLGRETLHSDVSCAARYRRFLTSSSAALSIDFDLVVPCLKSHRLNSGHYPTLARLHSAKITSNLTHLIQKLFDFHEEVHSKIQYCLYRMRRYNANPLIEADAVYQAFSSGFGALHSGVEFEARFVKKRENP